MSTQPDQSAEPRFVVTNTLIVADIKRSVAFYRDVLRATVQHEGEPTYLRLANIWLTINGGGRHRRQARRHRFAATRSKPSQLLSQPSRCRHSPLLRPLVFARRKIHHRAESPRNRTALLHARPRRLLHRGRTDHLDTRPTRPIRIVFGKTGSRRFRCNLWK